MILLLPLLWSSWRGSQEESAVQAVTVSLAACLSAVIGFGPGGGAAAAGSSSAEVLAFTFGFVALTGAITAPTALAARALRSSGERERQTRSRLEQLLSSTEDSAIILTDADGVVQQINETAARLYDSTVRELVGRPMAWFSGDQVLEVSPSPEQPQDAAQLGALLAEAAGGRYTDQQVMLRDGSVHWLDVSVAEVRAGAELLGYLITGMDITDRAATEQTLRRALEREQTSLRTLQDADRVKDELVSTISHELRTPITSILGYVEMLSEEIQDTAPALARLVRPVSRNANRLHRLVDDLLLLDALEHGDREPYRRSLDLATLATDAVDRANRAASRRVTISAGPGLTGYEAVVEGDQKQLRRVLDALIDNAVKFSPENGLVLVELTPGGSSRVAGAAAAVEISVRDSGPGIAEQDKDRVFERFFRASSAYADQVQGSGLGLALCKAVLEDHGGSIELGAAPGGGTEARCSLPAVVSAREPGRPPGELPPRDDRPSASIRATAVA